MLSLQEDSSHNDKIRFLETKPEVETVLNPRCITFSMKENKTNNKNSSKNNHIYSKNYHNYSKNNNNNNNNNNNTYSKNNNNNNNNHNDNHNDNDNNDNDSFMVEPRDQPLDEPKN